LGGVLNAHRFHACLDELSAQLGSNTAGFTVANTFVNHLLFADDMCVWSIHSVSDFQRLLITVVAMSLKAKKFGVVILSKNYKQRAAPNVYLNCARVEFHERFKYIGFLLHALHRRTTVQACSYGGHSGTMAPQIFCAPQIVL